MFSTIVVPLDGSDLAARAVPYAAQIARAAGGRLVLVRACREIDQTRVERAELMLGLARAEREERVQAEADLARLAQQLRADGLEVTTRVQVGDAAPTILEASRSVNADCIVMSTHGQSGLGRWLFGSVADAVIRQATLPVLLISPVCDHTWTADREFRILVPLDGSDAAEAILPAATELARAFRGQLFLLRVVESIPARVGIWSPEVATEVRQLDLAEARRYLRQVAERLSTTISAMTCTAVGRPGYMIPEMARRKRADLIAMTTHGRGGLRRLVMGSVALSTLQLTTLPLLLVRPVPGQSLEQADSRVEATQPQTERDDPSEASRPNHIEPDSAQT